MKTYEAMFLLDANMAADWPTAEAEVNRILDRAGAKVLGLKNWDERKLSYQIHQHKRGLYALAFFDAPADKIAGIERDVQLSEKAVRVLVLRREKLTPEKIEKAMTAPPPPKTSFRPDEWSGGRGRPDGRPDLRPMDGGGAAAPAAVEEVPDIDVLDV